MTMTSLRNTFWENRKPSKPGRFQKLDRKIGKSTGIPQRCPGQLQPPSPKYLRFVTPKKDPKGRKEHVMHHHFRVVIVYSWFMLVSNCSSFPGFIVIFGDDWGRPPSSGAFPICPGNIPETRFFPPPNPGISGVFSCQTVQTSRKLGNLVPRNHEGSH